MAASTREAGVRALVHMIARHKLYEDEGLHTLRADQRGAWTRLSVTCSCGRNWFLLDADIEPSYRYLLDLNQEARTVRFLNMAVGIARAAMLKVAPHVVAKVSPTRFDRDPPV